MRAVPSKANWNLPMFTQHGAHDAREQKRSVKNVMPQSRPWPLQEIATESGRHTKQEKEA